MQTAIEFSTDLIARFIGETAPEVVSTMLGWEPPQLVSRHESTEPATFEIGEINGSIGFGGRVTGTVFFSVSAEQGAAMASALMGEPVSTDSEEILDVIGELTNMISGGIKTRLNDAGFDTVMSIPSVIRGPSIRVAGKDIQFRLDKEFSAGETAGTFHVIMIGKVAND